MKKSYLLIAALSMLMLGMSTCGVSAQQKDSNCINPVGVVAGKLTVNDSISAAQNGGGTICQTTLTTGENTGATLTIDKLGKLELFPNTSIKISVEGSKASIFLDAGRFKMWTIKDASVTVTANDGVATLEDSSPAIFYG